MKNKKYFIINKCFGKNIMKGIIEFQGRLVILSVNLSITGFPKLGQVALFGAITENLERP